MEILSFIFKAVTYIKLPCLKSKCRTNRYIIYLKAHSLYTHYFGGRLGCHLEFLFVLKKQLLIFDSTDESKS